MSLSNSTTNIFRSQYYDDAYNPSTVDPTITQGEENDFLRVLFRPRYAVQSRELTTLQTMLQAQLERLGQASFKNGEAITGSEVALQTDVFSGKVLPSTNLVAFFDRTLNTGAEIFDVSANTSTAKIRQYLSADEQGITGADSYLIFKYETNNIFSPGTVVQSVTESSTQATFLSDANNTVFGEASTFSINEGIFFISGFFVRCAPQTIVLSTTTSQPDAIVGLTINEQIIDELDGIIGESLLDPANLNAPGAHRFRIQLVLSSRALTDSLSGNFIQIARIVNGVIHKTNNAGKQFVSWTDLNTILARRTYDTSGNYLIKNFAPVVGVDPSDPIPSSNDHFRLAIGPGKAYVQGFEATTTEPYNLSIRKGRATVNVTNEAMALQLGNYLEVTRVAATIPSDFFPNIAEVDLHCVPIASIDTTTSTTYAHSHIGTAKVRMLEASSIPASANLQANNSVYRLFFFDTAFDTISANITGSSQNNLTISLTTAVGPGVPAVNGAIVGATIVLGGASSLVSGTFTVNNYTVVGSAATIELLEFLPTRPNTNTQFRLLFQTKDIDSLATFDASVSTAHTPYSANLAFQADVDTIFGKTGNGSNLTTDVTNANRNALLYELPNKFIVANSLSIDTAQFSTWVITSANSGGSVTGSNTNAVFTLSVTGLEFALPTGNNLSATLLQEYLVIFDQTADANGRGEIIQFVDTPGVTDHCISNVAISKSGSQYNITLWFHSGGPNVSSGGSRDLIGLAKALTIGEPARQKTLMVGNTTAAVASAVGALDKGQMEFYTLNATPGFAYSLKTPDVYRITKVLYKDSNTAFANADFSTATDVTSQFILDTGQRDNTYEYSRLIVTNSTGVIRPTGRLLVIFDWFKHSGRGYCTVDSYLSSANILNGLTYDVIPTYTSAKTGQTIALRDALDFRPAQSNYEAENAVTLIVDASSNSVLVNTTYLTAASETYLIPSSSDEWVGNFSYYLGRIDHIGLAYDGTFTIIEGKDSLQPQPPTTDTGSLLLFQISVPPYTLVNANGVPTTTVLTTFDYKRYTMNDISSIENRVAHLEYYTALNSLETITRDTSVTDAEGNERFKNGIVVDSFQGGDVGDVANNDFTASIDTQNRELRTAFHSDALAFSPDMNFSTTTGVVLVGDMVTLQYSATPFVTQNLATHAVSVNPFDIASFYGNVKLSPAVDIWKETTGAPAQVIDLGGPSESWIQANAPSFTNWGEWEQTWSGITSSTPARSYSTPPGWTPDNHGFRSMTELSWQDVQTSTVYQQQGTQYEFTVTPTTASLGNLTIDTSIIHNVRARDIVFAAAGLKPQSSLYAFFDGTSVANYVQQANSLELTDMDTPLAPTFYIGQTVYVQKQITGTTAVAIANNTLVGTDTQYQYELVAGQLIRIKQGVNSFDTYIDSLTSNTLATLAVSLPPSTWATALIYTLTPVTIADIAPRYSGNTVSLTLKVVRAKRDADVDQVVPYAITAGSLDPTIRVSTDANTVGATLIVPASPLCNSATLVIANATCVSGVVRDYDSATGKLRLDNDIYAAAISNGATTIQFVGGPGAGQNTLISGFYTANQTVIVANTGILNIVAGETLYSVGPFIADGYVTGTTIAGRAGTAAGVFHMQAAQFAVGTRLFRLTDSPTNTPADATTSAEASYEASGLTVTQQDTTISSRQLGLVRVGPTQQSLTITDNSIDNLGVAYVDPLAETFLVDAKVYPQGLFITSVDLCFGQVPVDDIPVTLELRTVVNGYPSSQQILPCVSSSGIAQVVLRPDQVIVTATPAFDSINKTTFTFSAPVYLAPGEYGIIVRSDSDAYQIYTAELGATVLGTTDTKVSKQPYAGSFFKSQNASAWTESPFEDMMFQLNKAVWTGNPVANTSQQGVLVSRGVPPTTNTFFDSIEFYPHDVEFADMTATSFLLDILPMNPTTNDVTSSIAIRYAPVPNQWQPLDMRSMVQGFGGTADAANTVALRVVPTWSSAVLGVANTVDLMALLSTWSPDVAPYLDIKKTNMVIIQQFIGNMELRATDINILNAGQGYLVGNTAGVCNTSSGSPIVTGLGTTFLTDVVAGDTMIIGGNLAIIVGSVTNDVYLTAQSNVPVTRLSNTCFTFGTNGGNNAVALTFAGGNGTGAAGYAVIDRSGTLTQVVLSDVGSGYTGTPTVTVPAPVANTGYTITTTPAVLAYTSELGTDGGNGLTRYLIRSVTLADGFEARDIVVYFDAYRPSGSNFYLYYKVLPADASDGARFEDQAWRPMEQVTDNSTVSTKYTQYKEFQFKTPNDRALSAATDTTDNFKVFAVKIVMASDSTVNTPRIANFRAMALDS